MYASELVILCSVPNRVVQGLPPQQNDDYPPILRGARRVRTCVELI